MDLGEMTKAQLKEMARAYQRGQQQRDAERQGAPKVLMGIDPAHLLALLEENERQAADNAALLAELQRLRERVAELEAEADDEAMRHPGNPLLCEPR